MEGISECFDALPLNAIFVFDIEKWREMKGNIELLDMCIVFAFELIRAKDVRIYIYKEVKRSDDLWRFACGDV